MSKLPFALLALTVFTTACGSDAEEQCNDLLKAICKRARVCAEEVAGDDVPSNFESNCTKDLQESALDKDCSHATGVTSSYDKCLDDIESASCDDFLQIESDGVRIEPPSTCSKVIELE